MKNTNYLLAATTIALSSFLSGQAFAAAPAEPAKMEMAHSPSLTDGEVKKIDKEQGKITLKHGAIKHMDMPGMTMAFPLANPDVAKDIQAGDRVHVFVRSDAKGLTVERLEPIGERAGDQP